MRLKRKYIVTLCLILVASLAAFLWYPRETLVAPALRLRVFDEAGNPMSGLMVKQEWEYMAVGSVARFSYSTTDQNGYVEFPQRTEKLSGFRMGLSRLRELKNIMHGYRFGPHALVSAQGADPYVWAYVSCEAGRPVPQEMTLKRQSIRSIVD